MRELYLEEEKVAVKQVINTAQIRELFWGLPSGSQETPGELRAGKSSRRIPTNAANPI
ncbi:hypothetical protein [Microbulbifer echini]|uniref:hypothetical protein n=1 Tax=Microbulbifer echini TaxID=1529067 RepID=UPI003530E32C